MWSIGTRASRALFAKRYFPAIIVVSFSLIVVTETLCTQLLDLGWGDWENRLEQFGPVGYLLGWPLVVGEIVALFHVYLLHLIFPQQSLSEWGLTDAGWSSSLVTRTAVIFSFVFLSSVVVLINVTVVKVMRRFLKNDRT